MHVAGKKIAVTGGTRGLGLGIVEALVEANGKVAVVARDEAELTGLADRLPVETFVADITEQAAAAAIISVLRPDILILNAGAIPPMAPLDTIDWKAFTATWETDVKGGLNWVQAALNLPLAPGSKVLISSSGAAQHGSPMSGGYGGSKFMLWLMAKYAQNLSKEKGLDISFQAIVPKQMVGGTGVGGAGSSAYARAMGISQEAFLSRYPPMPPRKFGDYVVQILSDPGYAAALAVGIRGDTGVTVLEEHSV